MLCYSYCITLYCRLLNCIEQPNLCNETIMLKYTLCCGQIQLLKCSAFDSGHAPIGPILFTISAAYFPANNTDCEYGRHKVSRYFLDIVQWRHIMAFCSSGFANLLESRGNVDTLELHGWSQRLQARPLLSFTLSVLIVLSKTHMMSPVCGFKSDNRIVWMK